MINKKILTLFAIILISFPMIRAHSGSGNMYDRYAREGLELHNEKDDCRKAIEKYKQAVKNLPSDIMCISWCSESYGKLKERNLQIKSLQTAEKILMSYRANDK